MVLFRRIIVLGVTEFSSFVKKESTHRQQNPTRVDPPRRPEPTSVKVKTTDHHPTDWIFSGTTPSTPLPDEVYRGVGRPVRSIRKRRFRLLFSSTLCVVVRKFKHEHSVSEGRETGFVPWFYLSLDPHPSVRVKEVTLLEVSVHRFLHPSPSSSPSSYVGIWYDGRGSRTELSDLIPSSWLGTTHIIHIIKPLSPILSNVPKCFVL